MKQKNKRIPRNKTNSINSNKAENNMGKDGKKDLIQKAHVILKSYFVSEEGLKRNLWSQKI